MKCGPSASLVSWNWDFYLTEKKQKGYGVLSHFVRKNINFSCNPDRMIFRRKLILTIGSFTYFRFLMRKQWNGRPGSFPIFLCKAPEFLLPAPSLWPSTTHTLTSPQRDIKHNTSPFLQVNKGWVEGTVYQGFLFDKAKRATSGRRISKCGRIKQERSPWIERKEE